MIRRLIFLLSFFLPLSLCAQQGVAGTGGPGPYKAQHLTVELVAANHEVAQGTDATLGLVFTMEDEWHVYWINAGDAGEPPKVDWTLPSGITAGTLLFPTPSRLPLPPFMDFGYENEVAFPLHLHVDPKAKLGVQKLKAKVSWLVCSSSGCLPGSARMGIDLKVVAASQAERLRAATEAASKVGPLGTAFANMPQPLPEDASVAVTVTPTEWILTAHLGEQAKTAEFYPLDTDIIVNAGEQKAEPLSDGVVLHVPRAPDLKTVPKSVHGVLKIEEGDAYEFTSPVKLAVAAPVQAPAAPHTSSASTLSAIPAILLAFLGGALLNLMPCVFPVLFLKALALVQSSTSEKKDKLNHGLMYTVGIIVSFWAILAVLLALRAGGSQLGWGFQMQSPGFVAVLAIVVFFFSLSLAGMFDLGLSLTSVGGGLAQKEGYTGSFFTGVLATVVATPCTAPLMGPAIGFALTQSTAVTFAIFTALGVGLAAPYLVLTANPGWTRILPRPGAWMEVLKQITALPLFGTVIWLVYLYGSLFSAEQGLYNAAFLLMGLLIVAIAGWVLHRWPAGWRGSIGALLIGLAAIAIPFHYRAPEVESSTWQPYSKDALAEARAKHTPVFVDFTAKWCLSCQVNERLVLNSHEVQKRFSEKHVLLLKADWTRYDPAITAELAAVGRNGVPTYVIYPADAATKPDVLPEVLSKDVVISALDRDLK